MAVIQRNKKVFQSATANSHVNCETKSLNKIPDHILTKLTNFNGYKMGLLNYMIIEYVKLLEDWMTLQKSVTMFYMSKLKWNSYSPDSKVFYSFFLYSSISINSDRYNLHA